MLRRPKPVTMSTALPALATLLASCQHEPPRYAPTGAPSDPPPPPPAQSQDAGGPTSLAPTRIDIQMPRDMPMGGAPVMVSPLPPRAPQPAPAPAPAPAPPSASAPSPASAPSAASAPAAPPAGRSLASAETEGLAPGLYLVHRHAPGTPCHPVSRTELEMAADSARRTP